MAYQGVRVSVHDLLHFISVLQLVVGILCPNPTTSRWDTLPQSCNFSLGYFVPVLQLLVGILCPGPAASRWDTALLLIISRCQVKLA